MIPSRIRILLLVQQMLQLCRLYWCRLEPEGDALNPHRVVDRAFAGQRVGTGISATTKNNLLPAINPVGQTLRAQHPKWCGGSKGQYQVCDPVADRKRWIICCLQQRLRGSSKMSRECPRTAAGEDIIFDIAVGLLPDARRACVGVRNDHIRWLRFAPQCRVASTLGGIAPSARGIEESTPPLGRGSF